ncbi:mRNA decapping complex subunit-like protein [Emericellopsis cladophorae]|uniref:mRNA decapping complex subunit-like protein n=1 Tax=Emericellopsis cladophorae TaxID=2686198 RepID=A0A9P9XY88_9HYPO|nr:mRNA decapping complex subunit-like protein [Emericellopsis cladophorae]KAI6779534.1 mRNA decapping complex subunit-like protein [Emericellopsis cladophorae]
MMAGKAMQLEDWLDDLCVRFIINLPQEDLSSVARICFQVEEAQWFYEDFVRPLDPNLPSMSLRTFCLRIFQHCPILASFPAESHVRAFEEFLQYKTRVPVRGAIMLNEQMDSTVLVKGWKKGANWSFPRGKINKDEADLDCAVREVWEETGLDLRAAGLVPKEPPKALEVTMREQQIRLYVFRNVPMDTHFQTQTRKEISKIQWYKLSELPAFRKKNQGQDAANSTNKFYMVAPFLFQLKKWVATQKKMDARQAGMLYDSQLNANFSVDEAPTEEDGYPQEPPPPPPHYQHDGVPSAMAGATGDLQRLLNVQPATQNPQMQPNMEDKASALLSILQVKDTASEGQYRQGQDQLSHTQSEMAAGGALHQHNPHHHSSQHQYHAHNHSEQPPPALHLHQHHHGPTFTVAQEPNQHGSQQPYQQSQGLSSQEQSQQLLQQFFQQGKAPAHDFGGTPRQTQPQPAAAPAAQLVHPQPLPPQIQRAMFNKSTFQENSSHATQPQAQASVAKAGTGQAASNPGPAPAHLNGQSMALLNAFKRDAGISPQAQHEAVPAPAPQPMPPQATQQATQQSLFFSKSTSRTQQPTATSQVPQPSELAGSKPSAQPDQYRSSLLGMFKTAEASPSPKPITSSAQPGVHAAQKQSLLDALRGGPQETQPLTKPTPPQASDPSTVALSSFLTMKPREEQKPRHAQMPPPQAQPQQAQPIRILQRGQAADSINYAPPMQDKSTSRSPYAVQSSAGSHHYATPPVASAQPSPASSQRRPEPSHDQRRQLLSLFGGMQQQPPAPSSGPGVAEMGSGQASPARGGTSTPMSPAEQTFLLDYLQSVTNTASR